MSNEVEFGFPTKTQDPMTNNFLTLGYQAGAACEVIAADDD